MNIPENLSYTKEHEWIEDLGSGNYRVGITDYAQDALGDVIFLEVKDVGIQVAKGEVLGEAESTKSVSDLYAPISGSLKAVNSDLTDTPELVNSDPYGKGWICEIEASEIVQKELEFLSPEDYKELVEN